ncbi:C69 family dipeptidase [Streptococcus oricebi]|uniref:membrane dipeptidase n=1 Tax=Streptococcus oricebi TaxID=1547447 RepID=A0ABS5B3F4_9STRE|nr:C69 family dipeptidase [Streptococcus oricebi]MBP2623355.1 dipeptidase [Streptococcus oricebi]
MKKLLFRSLLILAICLLFPVQIVQACTGFIVGKNLTTDGSALYGRTEDLEPNHNKVFKVNKAKSNPAGSVLTDQANGFSWKLPEQSYQYTSVSDVTPQEGIFDEVGFNEHGVSISATVSAKANKQIQGVDPYVENGLAESIITTLVLPHVKSAREGVELLAKVVREQGAAEGNILVLADKEGIWYMEILSGHQYVAIKYPDDKYSVFPNTFFLGSVDFQDQENVIASKDVEKVAKDAGVYKEIDGRFHISQSYNPPMSEADRSRAWAGITALNPNAPVKYDDAYFDLFQSSSQPIGVADVMRMQRNRFEGTPFKPLDQMELDGKGLPKRGTIDPVYKYPLGNPNVMEAHIFQLKDSIPASMGGGTMWLAVGSPRFSPYLPYYGNITDTYSAYQVEDKSYNPQSWYWVASHIYDMAAKHRDLFESQVQEKWKALEARLIEEQAALDAKYANNQGDSSQEVTQASLARAEQVFKEMKALEAEMEAKIKEKDSQPSSSSSSSSTSSSQEPSSSSSSSSKADEPSQPSQSSSNSNPSESSSQPSPSSDLIQPLVDPASGIQIFNKDLSPSTTGLTVKKLDQLDSLKGRTYDAYDIRLEDLKTKQNLSKVSPSLVSIPTRKDAQVEAVYSLAANGQLEKFDFESKDQTVSFTTNHFSTYAVVYKDAQVKTNAWSKTLPLTGEQMSLLGLVGLIILIVLAFVFIKAKKQK